MKYYIDPDGKQHRTLPKVWNNTSPITEEYVISHGWSVHEGDEPKEKLMADMISTITAYSAQMPDISVNEFFEVCIDGFSSDIIAWAKGKGIPDDFIAEARNVFMNFIGDASRLGMTWDDLFNELKERINESGN